MLSQIADQLLGLRGAAAYAIVAALVFAEDALFIGFVFPGETAAILGGVAASLGHVGLLQMISVVALAAIVGDNVGYEIGRWFGPRLLSSRLLRRQRGRLDKAQRFLARRGGPAVFVGRFTAFLRTVLPTLVGTAQMRYREFLAYNAAGGIAWAVSAVLAGYLAGHSYATFERIFGRAAAIATAVIVVLLLVGWRLYRRCAHRRRRRASDAHDERRRSRRENDGGERRERRER